MCVLFLHLQSELFTTKSTGLLLLIKCPDGKKNKVGVLFKSSQHITFDLYEVRVSQLFQKLRFWDANMKG